MVLLGACRTSGLSGAVLLCEQLAVPQGGDAREAGSVRCVGLASPLPFCLENAFAPLAAGILLPCMVRVGWVSGAQGAELLRDR